MAVSTGSYLESFHQKSQAMGAKLVTSDFVLEIDGFEGNYLLTKQFPLPVLSTGEPVEVASVLGTKYTEPGQVQFYKSGSVTFYETVAGSIDSMLKAIICKGGNFNAWVYHGTPSNFTWKRRIKNCEFVIDNPDTDWESATQALLVGGTIHFHYYGEEVKGGVPHLNGGEGQGGKC